LPWRLKTKLVLDATQLLDWRSDGVECRQSKIKKRLWPLFQGKSSSAAAVYFEILWQMGGPTCGVLIGHI